MPAAIGGVPKVNCFMAAAAIGSAYGRTLILFRCLRNPDSPYRIADVSADWAIAGGSIGVLFILGAGLLGLKSLPDWTEIPVVVVAVQTGFGLVLGRLLTKRLGPLNADPAKPTYEQVAFTLFGAITLPGLTVFIVTMTLVTVLA